MQFYNIATKVNSRKSATTFGDLPDCLPNFSGSWDNVADTLDFRSRAPGFIIHLQGLGAVSIRKTVFPGMAIPMLKIRRPSGRLIFNMEIAIRR